MNQPLGDIAAKVRQQLYDRARKTNRPFTELLQYYAMERFLYRLSKSKHRDKFTLKGALMFIVWKAPRARATKDIDFLGRANNAVEKLVSIVQDVCAAQVDPDGMEFAAKRVAGERIQENADYQGVRIRFLGHLGRAQASMKLDVGFGDKVTPRPAMIDYPVILDMPAPRLKGYPPETVVAEKVEAMVKLGIINTRMKDFYDVWLLAQQFNFDGEVLAKALKNTFAYRRTKFTMNPVAFSRRFTADAQKKAQWAAFVRKTGLANAPADLGPAIQRIRGFVLPVVESIMAGKPHHLRWEAPGPWR